MRQPSIRGIGIRYMLAMILPLTGAILVLYTIAQLVGYQMGERRSARGPLRPAIAGSTALPADAAPPSAYPPPSPKK